MKIAEKRQSLDDVMDGITRYKNVALKYEFTWSDKKESNLTVEDIIGFKPSVLLTRIPLLANGSHVR